MWKIIQTLKYPPDCIPQGPVVQKLINANSILNIYQGVFLYSQMLFNADIWQNFTLEEAILEKQK